MTGNHLTRLIEGALRMAGEGHEEYVAEIERPAMGSVARHERI